MIEPIIVCDCGLELPADESADKTAVQPAIIRIARCPECGRNHWQFIPQPNESRSKDHK